MSKYDSKEFISKFTKRMNGRDIPSCRFCGGQRFTSTDKLATILIGDDLNSISIGPSIPSGMIVCENCGHIEFFALGALGLLSKKEEATDGK